MEDEAKTKEQLIRELHELREKVAELQQSERQFKAIADCTPDWQNWVGLDGKLRWVNTAVTNMTGYSIAECLAMEDFPASFCVEDDRERARSAFVEAVRGTITDNIEFRMVCKNGQQKWASVSWRPMYDQNGHHLGHRSSIRDISARKHLEGKLQNAYQQLEVAQQAAGAGVWIWNLQTGVFEWSPELYTLFGLDPARDEASFDTWRRIVHPEDLERAEQKINVAVEKNTDLHNDYRIVLPSGDIRWIYAVGRTTCYREDKALVMTGICLDVTERKQTEEALRKSEENFRALVEASSDVMYRMSPDWREMRLLRGRDFIPNTGTPSETWLNRYISPDDQPQMLAAINTAIQNKSVFELVHRIRRADGSVGWTFSRAVPIMNDSGEITEWLGMAKDITQRVQNEDELANYRSNLERLINIRTTELENKTKQLEENVTTLRVLLDQREKDKEELHDQIMANLRQLVIPYIEKLRVLNPHQEERLYLDALENALLNIVSPFAHRLLYKNVNFTPKELQVANLIADGKSSKEIAEILNLSIRTVEFHRDNIRKRLGISKTDANLRAYLMTHT